MSSLIVAIEGEVRIGLNMLYRGSPRRLLAGQMTLGSHHHHHLLAGSIIMEAGSRSFVPARARVRSGSFFRSYGTKASCGVVPVHSTPRTHLVLEKDTGRK